MQDARILRDVYSWIHSGRKEIILLCWLDILIPIPIPIDRLFQTATSWEEILQDRMVIDTYMVG